MPQYKRISAILSGIYGIEIIIGKRSIPAVL